MRGGNDSQYRVTFLGDRCTLFIALAFPLPIQTWRACFSVKLRGELTPQPRSWCRFNVYTYSRWTVSQPGWVTLSSPGPDVPLGLTPSVNATGHDVEKLVNTHATRSWKSLQPAVNVCNSCVYAELQWKWVLKCLSRIQVFRGPEAGIPHRFLLIHGDLYTDTEQAEPRLTLKCVV